MDKVIIGDATIHCGDVLEVLKGMASESVHCCVTSPPYWGLRDYKAGSQMIGLEPTFQDWLDKMVLVCREVRRVLRKDGTFWLNVGDCYAGGGRGAYCDDGSKQSTNAGCLSSDLKLKKYTHPDGFKPKDLLMMPARLAIALQSDGWWVRSEIIWAKPNPMPESVTDRPTSSHEKIYLLTKAGRYFYDAIAVREGSQVFIRKAGGYKTHNNQMVDDYEPFKGKGGFADSDVTTIGRNSRNVWTINTQSYEGAHFATFPEEIPRRCILAGTSDKGCCPECGAPWERVVEIIEHVGHKQREDELRMKCGSGEHFSNLKEDKGWQPTCSCGNPNTVPCTVLDIFAGSGTTLKVALELGRKTIGIELNPDYIPLIMKRIESEANQIKLF